MVIVGRGNLRNTLGRPVCGCGNWCRTKGTYKGFRQVYGTSCHKCRGFARQHKKTSCDACGFSPGDNKKLDIDHIDGNSSNNDLGNIQTLCKPCHREKTLKNREWRKRNERM